VGFLHLQKVLEMSEMSALVVTCQLGGTHVLIIGFADFVTASSWSLIDFW